MQRRQLILEDAALQYLEDRIVTADGEQLARFANEVEVAVGQAVGADGEAIFRAQIGDTIRAHFSGALGVNYGVVTSAADVH